MGAAVPQVITETKASGAQVIDGSLKFNGSRSTALKRTPSSEGNRRTWTWSAWVKKHKDSRSTLFSAGATSSDTGFAALEIETDEQLRYLGWNTLWKESTEVFRDYNQFYHIVVAFDVEQATASNRVRLYKNGVEITNLATNNSLTNTDYPINDNVIHYIGGIDGGGGENITFNDYYMTQVYLIDGQQLGPENFGFTDPLTNTWRPKKLSKLSGPNDGRIWTNTATISSGSNAANKPLSNGFDGTTATAFEGDTSGATVTVPVSATISAGGVRVFAAVTSGNPLVVAIKNGASTVETINTGSSGGQYYASSSYSGAITSLVISRTGRAPEFNAIEINGTMLIDGDRTNFGSNGFYLPFDGNSPIGQDKSGRGNNWTPVNFGNLVELDKATGARPILNTTHGGTQATDGVFGSKENKYYTLTGSSGSGSGYVFENEGTKPTLSMIRGATYTFDYSAASSHPFRFATAADAAGSTQYTNGTSVSGNVIKFTVPHNAPDTLYYYCTNHGGMGNSISVTTDETKADSYAWQNVLALPLVGRFNDLSNSINNTTSTKSMSVSGNTSANYQYSNFYGGSHYFDGSADHINAASSSDFGMGTGDFTIEAWVHPTQMYSSNFIVCLSASDSIFGYDSDGSVNLQLPSSGAPALTQLGPKIANNRWNHFAAVRESGTLRGYVNGVLAATVSNATTDMGSSGTVTIGDHPSLSREIKGYLQDVRIYKGVAKYSSDFLVPATQPDVLPDTPSGVSGGSKLTNIIDGAVTFSGGGDYLEVKSSTDFAFGTGDFTMEAYVYATSFPSTNQRIFCSGADGSGSRTNFQLMVGSAGYLEFAHSSNYQTANGLIGLNKWYHVAATREGTTLRMFIDGVLHHTGTSNVNVTENGGVTIGREFGYSSYWYGMISNARIIKGTALYTANFTPPKEPLTNVTNTKLLCCQSSATPARPTVGGYISGVNDGQVWSHGTLSGSIENVRPWHLGFNGDLSTFTRPTNNVMAQIIFETPIAFSSKFEIKGTLDSGSVGSIEVLDGTNNFINVTSSFGNVTANPTDYPKVNLTSSLTSPVKGIRFNGVAGAINQPRFTAVYVDDTLLIDPVIQKGTPTSSNFNPFTTDINMVRGQESGYATMDTNHNSTGSSFSDGNLSVSNSTGWHSQTGTIGVTSGKWYYEWRKTSGSYTGVGWSNKKEFAGNPSYNRVGGGIYLSHNGNKQSSDGSVSYGETYGNDDTIGVAFDRDTGTIEFFKNGISQGIAFIGQTGSTTQYAGNVFYPEFHLYQSGGTVNFGQKPFRFAPPPGYQPLNAANVLSDKVVARPDQYVGTVTYTGDGNSPRKVSGYNFGPDLIWYKQRNTARDHQLYDTVRGPGSNKNLSTNTNYSETNNDDELYGYTSGFDDNGFTVTTGSSNFNYANANGSTYVAWAWKAGGSKGTFNKDGVDMGSAANAKMSAGSLNSEAYNQSAVWSNGVTTNGVASIADLFDGNFGTSAQQTTNGTPATISGFGPITVQNKVSFYSPDGSARYRLNLGDERYIDGAGWHDIEFTGTLSSFSFQAPGNSRVFIYGMMIDGKLLVNNGVSVANIPSIAATASSVGTKQGFSIIKYTGSGSNGTIPHGLSQAPDFMFGRDLDDTGTSRDWIIYHKVVGGSGRLKFNTDQTSSSSTFFQNQQTRDTHITVGTSNDINSTNDYIMYCWHDVPGLQRFGSFEATGDSSRGPFVELGFRPALIICKSIDSNARNWLIFDSKRTTANPMGAYLSADGAGAEGTYTACDFLNNGFKVRSTNLQELNITGETYIYAAWAEAPSFNLFGGQSNAR